jgi:hypothetical protein
MNQLIARRTYAFLEGYGRTHPNTPAQRAACRAGLVGTKALALLFLVLLAALVMVVPIQMASLT